MVTKAGTHITLSYNSNALAGYLDQVSIEAVVKELIATVLTSTGEIKIPGVTNWSIPVGGPWSKAVDDILNPDAVSPPDSGGLRTLVAVYGPSGSTVTLTWTASGDVGAFVGNYKVIGNNPNELMKWTGTLSVSGAPTRS
ncbi:MAG: hypothetical protein U0350_36375 [Caldilineaceae bacterium]